ISSTGRTIAPQRPTTRRRSTVVRRWRRVRRHGRCTPTARRWTSTTSRTRTSSAPASSRRQARRTETVRTCGPEWPPRAACSCARSRASAGGGADAGPARRTTSTSHPMAVSWRLWRNRDCAAGPRWTPRCGVLGRAGSTTTGAPCVLAARRPSHPCDEHHSARLSLALRLLEEVLPAREEPLERIPRLLVRRQRLDVRPVRGEPALEVGNLGLAGGDLCLDLLELARALRRRLGGLAFPLDLRLGLDGARRALFTPAQHLGPATVVG